MQYYHIIENLESTEKGKRIKSNPTSLIQTLLAFWQISFESFSYAYFNIVIIIFTYIFYFPPFFHSA